VAQQGGDGYSVRRYLGNEAYLLDTYTQPKPFSPTSQLNGRSPVRQAVAQMPMPQPIMPQAPTLTSGTNNTLNYYGGASARATLSQMPTRQRFIPQGGASVGVGSTSQKSNSRQPGTATDPTLSPYLNLFREEREDSLPNYYTFVRPAVQQVETNRNQQRQLQGLQRQVQRTAYQTQPVGTLPPTGTRSRFGDTGQYFSGFNR
jgi:hypothetical protein